MTDELTPAQEERVRGLLADARHDEPMPTQVVDRLDAVLADLGRQPAATVPSLDVVRRRRRGTALLVAAAAVTVLGVGAKPLLQNVISPMSGGDKSASGGAADNAADAPPMERAPTAAGGDEDLLVGALPLDKDAFDAQVRELATDTAALKQNASEDYARPGPACPRLRTWGKGELYYATYDGRSGALVFRAPIGTTQRVDLFLCRQRSPERTTYIPVG